jgi:hypothetical protein
MFPILPILSGIGQGLSAGAGSESTTDSSMESTTTGTSDISRTEFSNKILKTLEGLIKRGQLKKDQRLTRDSITSLIGTVTQGAQTPFDVEKFVDGIMTQANNTVGNELDIAKNLTQAEVGASQGSNSMLALLGNKLATDAAAQLAGIEADATARGVEIAEGQQQSDVQSIMGLTQGLRAMSTDYLQILRGARTKQHQETEEHTEGTSTSTTSSPFNPMSALGGLLGSFKAPE